MVSGVVSSIGMFPPCAAPRRPRATTRTTRQVANFLSHISPSTRGYGFRFVRLKLELVEQVWRREGEGKQTLAGGQLLWARGLEIDRHHGHRRGGPARHLQRQRDADAGRAAGPRTRAMTRGRLVMGRVTARNRPG